MYNGNNGTTAYGNVPVPAAGHNFQQGGLTYQQTLPSTQPGALGGGGAGDVKAQAPQPEGDYPVVMAIDFGMSLFFFLVLMFLSLSVCDVRWLG